MNHQEIYEKVYALMDTSIIDDNCGLLCNFHCCREEHESGERMGMYLLPYEYESIQTKVSPEFEIHQNGDYDLPPKTKQLYYMFCDGARNCLREYRPIQCRTYPLEPHLIGGQLHLVIEKDQIHACPLLSQQERWRPEFIEGIYQGWKLLVTIPEVRYFIEQLTQERIYDGNILKIIR